MNVPIMMVSTTIERIPRSLMRGSDAIDLPHFQIVQCSIEEDRSVFEEKRDGSETKRKPESRSSIRGTQIRGKDNGQGMVMKWLRM